MTHARSALDQQMRQTLAELEMLSHGSVQSYNSSGGGAGDNPDPTPKGGRGAEHLYWRRMYGPPFTIDMACNAKDDQERTDVIQGAQDALKSARGHGIDRSGVIGETKEQEDARIIHDGDGFPVDEVALRFHCTPTRVRNARRAAHRSIELGRPLANASDTPLATNDRKLKAIEYHEQGMTLTQISRLLHCDKATISRDLKAA